MMLLFVNTPQAATPPVPKAAVAPEAAPKVAPHSSTSEICYSIERHAGGITSATCSQLATAIAGSLLVNGVTLVSTFTCSTFNDTSATVCAVGLTSADAATFLANFKSDTAVFAQIIIQFKLICQNIGPESDRYDDQASVSTCVGDSMKPVPCEQPKPPPFPFCACNHASGTTPFSFSTDITESAYAPVAGKAANLYTFTIVIGPGSGAGASQTMAAKAEFWIHESMK